MDLVFHSITRSGTDEMRFRALRWLIGAASWRLEGNAQESNGETNVSNENLRVSEHHKKHTYAKATAILIEQEHRENAISVYLCEYMKFNSHDCANLST